MAESRVCKILLLYLSIAGTQPRGAFGGSAPQIFLFPEKFVLKI